MSQAEREEILLRALGFQLEETVSEENRDQFTREIGSLRGRVQGLHRELTAAIQFARRVAELVDLCDAEEGAVSDGSRVKTISLSLRTELRKLVDSQRNLRGYDEKSCAPILRSVISTPGGRANRWFDELLRAGIQLAGETEVKSVEPLR